VAYFRALHPIISQRRAELSSVSVYAGLHDKWQCAVFLTEYFKDCSLNVVMHSHASAPSHPARVFKFDHYSCRYKPVVQKTEGYYVWAHVNFVSNPSEFCKWRHFWSGLGDVISQLYRRWCRSVCSDLVKNDVSFLEFNKCQSVRSKVVRNYVHVPPSFRNVCQSSVRKSSRSGFLPTDFKQLLTFTRYQVVLAWKHLSWH